MALTTAASPGGTVLLNEDGTVAYPSHIPPEVDVPRIQSATTSEYDNNFSTSLPDRSKAVEHQPTDPQSTYSHNNRPTLSRDPQSTYTHDNRPPLSQDWETEQPPIQSDPAPPFLRSGTNLSAFKRSQEAVESSDSSSSDEEEVVAHQKQARFARRRPQHVQHKSRRHFHATNEHFSTKGNVSKKDGRLNISVNETGNKGYLAKALGANYIRHPEMHMHTTIGNDVDRASRPQSDNLHHGSDSSAVQAPAGPPRPKLNIVIMVIGSRGDIQPFLKLGKSLKEEHGHRVRIATHPAFREFVQKDSDLEFFSIGGDPSELMAFMVKNPGMIPKMETVKAGEIGRRRDQMAEMFDGFWRACINTTDDEHNSKNIKLMQGIPFVADAIIANPVSFAHIHCAERLGIPLHLMFTFPYTPTQQFPHPLANIKKSNVDPGYSNFMSYPLVDMMTWQGLGDLINNFREKTLGLEPVSTLWAPGQIYRLHVPYTYLWSPGLIPKPADWGPEIDIAGFVFLDLASSFDPPKELTEFLDAGDPPIYIGFGSIVVDDPDKFTKMIFEAVEQAGVRALVSKGWGGLGDDNVPDNIFMLENTPHDWLFPRVKAVVHHGGAGTNAIGLKCGKPTMIVPFFGDQMFWGSMVAKAGAGPEPIPYKDLDKDKLADGLTALLTDECQTAAEKLAKGIDEEGDGAQNAVKSFHRSLTLRGERSLRCTMLEDRVAVWQLKGTQLRLSALAATLLVQQRKVTWKQLRLIRHVEWNDFEGPGEPLTGATTAVVGNLTGIATGIGGIPYKITKHTKKRQKHGEKKRRLSTQGRKSVDESARVKDQASHGTDETEQHTGNGDLLRGAAETTAQTTARGEPSNLNENKKNLGKSKHDNKEQSDAKDDKKGSKNKDDSDNISTLSADPEDTAYTEVAKDVGLGFGKTGENLARIPLDLTMALAQGFHNAPRLYGDTTVRRPTRVTGYKSGLKAAGEELAFGVYDGVTGLVTQPYIHARDEGAVGFIKGVGMGIGGFVLKDLAAIFGPFGYTFKGIEKEITKYKQPTALIRRARQIQGEVDLKDNDEETNLRNREIVAHGWSVAQQFWVALEETRASNGLTGRFRAMKERKHWRDYGAFENVESAERALEARRKGESLQDVFAQQKAEIEEATKSQKKNVVDDIEESKEKQHDGNDRGGEDRRASNSEKSVDHQQYGGGGSWVGTGIGSNRRSGDRRRSSVHDPDGKKSYRMSWTGRKSLSKPSGQTATSGSGEENKIADDNFQLGRNEKEDERERRQETDLTSVMLRANGIEAPEQGGGGKEGISGQIDV